LPSNSRPQRQAASVEIYTPLGNRSLKNRYNEPRMTACYLFIGGLNTLTWIAPNVRIFRHILAFVAADWADYPPIWEVATAVS
jgi:hypothetical protein